MKLMIAYGLISFSIGMGISGIAGRILNVPWLFGKFSPGDPGMAFSTAAAIICLGSGIFILQSVWRGRKSQTNKKEVT